VPVTARQARDHAHFATHRRHAVTAERHRRHVIALWLGQEQLATAQTYLHADMAQKERAIARVTPAGTQPGRYRPPDALLAFLEHL
jgi:hypothetical protein